MKPGQEVAPALRGALPDVETAPPSR
jgi:hypothetical protein